MAFGFAGPATDVQGVDQRRIAEMSTGQIEQRLCLRCHVDVGVLSGERDGAVQVVSVGVAKPIELGGLGMLVVGRHGALPTGSRRRFRLGTRR